MNCGADNGHARAGLARCSVPAGPKGAGGRQLARELGHALWRAWRWWLGSLSWPTGGAGLAGPAAPLGAAFSPLTPSWLNKKIFTQMSQELDYNPVDLVNSSRHSHELGPGQTTPQVMKTADQNKAKSNKRWRWNQDGNHRGGRHLKTRG